ncbi:MAG: hypothetical protein JST38_17495 [Bacteroidetes bacterium]|nr:hypothetical protein [Bacteroidota bacterium]
MQQLLTLILLGGLLFAGCKGNNPSQQTALSTPAQADVAPAATVENQQAMDSLLTVLGPLQGRTVADMFAGDGFYTWGMLKAGARVLAIDDNPANIAALEARKKQDGIGDDRLLIRQTTPGAPGLLANEVDMALITREYSTLGDRPSWFAQLKSGIRSPHLFYLVNFIPGQTAAGPPLSQRMGYNTVSNEVTEFGFEDVGIFYKKMQYRYILFGSVPPESRPDEGEGQ